ncbi:hypothetical protein M378DRAFT_690781, partial [Amanita muscaria Koide BX008]
EHKLARYIVQSEERSLVLYRGVKARKELSHHRTHTCLIYANVSHFPYACASVDGARFEGFSTLHESSAECSLRVCNFESPTYCPPRSSFLHAYSRAPPVSNLNRKCQLPFLRECGYSRYLIMVRRGC